MCWRLVYANDASGKSVYGDVDGLIRAVRDGRSVRVVLESKEPFPAPHDTSLHSFEANAIRVRKGIVFAVNTLDVSSNYVDDDCLFIEDSYYYMLTASTKGILEQIRWNVGEHVMRGHNQIRLAMRWFTD